LFDDSSEIDYAAIVRQVDVEANIIVVLTTHDSLLPPVCYRSVINIRKNVYARVLDEGTFALRSVG